MKKSFYDILGVKKDAKKEEIDGAWRKKRGKAHPDKGGDEEEFKMMKKAVEVLSNPEKRRKYDQTGEYQETASDKATEIFTGILMSLLDSEQVLNPIEELKKGITTKQRELTNGLKICTRKRKLYLKRKKNLKKKNKKAENIGFLLINRLRLGNIQQYFNLKEEIKIGKKILILAEDWEYEMDKPEAPTSSGPFVFFGPGSFPFPS